jgi:hypothetical protein
MASSRSIAFSKFNSEGFGLLLMAKCEVKHSAEKWKARTWQR